MTPEARAAARAYADHGYSTPREKALVGHLTSALDYIDALEARIAELEGRVSSLRFAYHAATGDDWTHAAAELGLELGDAS